MRDITRAAPSGVSGSSSAGIAVYNSKNALSEQILSSLYCNNIRRIGIPRTHGEWNSEPGNSNFSPYDDAQFYVGHGKKMTGKQLKEKYSFTSIAFRNNIPDFMPFANTQIGIIALDTRPMDRKTSYQLAENQCVSNGLFKNASDVRDFMKHYDLVWHECGDGKTMIAIPMAINQAFRHLGGIGINNGLLKIRKRLPSTDTVLSRKTSMKGIWHRVR